MLAPFLALALAAPPAAGKAPARGPAVPAASLPQAHPLLPILCDVMRGVMVVLDPPPDTSGTTAAPAPGATTTIRPSLITYDVSDVRGWSLSAGFGALEANDSSRDLRATVRMRVGDKQTDNTHHVANDDGEMMRIAGASSAVPLPVDASPALIRRVLEDETDRRWVRAVADLGHVKAARAQASAQEDDSPDLSTEQPEVAIEPLARLTFDPAPWTDRLRRITAPFRDQPKLLGQDTWLRVTDEVRLLVTSEGTVVQQRNPRVFLGMQVWTRTADGEDLALHWDVFARDVAALPGEKALLARAADMAKRIEALRLAPPAEPYVGPMLLAGQGAGVLFHEVLGHPLEGERQRAEEQAQTFKGKVGERILADFIDIVFDPTLLTLGDVPLSGAYRFDDEGVKARPVVAVEKGVLRSFLLSRRPIAGFPRSNGHGRSEGMPLPVARQSNLFVKTSTPQTEAALRQKLVELARARGLAYGLYVATVERGATRTSRGEPNAFNVVPREVFRVWVDGRPDQLIRGAELVGTPLAALLKIAAAGDRPETFNGVCGAESGWVPVSASSPPLLFEEIEVQRAAKSSQREPVLPPPGAEEAKR